MFIFPRVRYHDSFISAAPVGSIERSAKSGWMNENLFMEYLKHFKKETRCTMDRKVLLVMDNHESHISLQAADFARYNGIVKLTIPPHTSHKLQRLDRCVYGPFKGYYNWAMDSWIQNNPGTVASIRHIPAIAHSAFLSAMAQTKIIAGFSSTRICLIHYNCLHFSIVDRRTFLALK